MPKLNAITICKRSRLYEWCARHIPYWPLPFKDKRQRVRYTTLPNYATGGYDDIGWVIKDGFEPTEDQKRKMFELTGKIVE